MVRVFVVLASMFGFLGVAIGAFGAHGLKKHFETHPDLLVIFETGVKYHMYHALALLGVAWAASRWGGALLHWSGYLMVFGVIVFSGSLYALSVSGVRGFGAITPVGGLALLVGWLLLGLGAWKGQSG